MTRRAAPAEPWDAVVVGAGPGGSAAAYHLARAGRRVLLLDRQAFPRDKSCGDGITRSGAELLEEMGVLERLLPEGAPTGGVRVHMRGRGARDFAYPPGPGGLVVPRLHLDAVLASRAVEAGAEFRPATEARRMLWRDGRVSGVCIREAASGTEMALESRFLIAADGAASPLGRQAGLLTEASGWGSALRGYFAGIAGLDDRLEIFMPLTDASDAYLLPSYGWVFPLGGGMANIGVGLFEREAGENLRGLFMRFLSSLRATDRRFAAMHPSGPMRGAPLRFDFAPERCAVPGLLLVGDAAGLVSPFTGEGISYALESGRIAAQVIDRCLRGEVPAETEVHDYAMLLEQRFAGYFEAGRSAGQRYRLVWHVLDSTFRSERPLHRLCRRLVLVPEGTGEPLEMAALTDVAPLLPLQGRRLRPEMLAVGATLGATLRRDWPFLAQLAGTGRGVRGVPFRPSLLLLLCAQARSGTGAERQKALRQAAAAVELGILGFLVQGSVQEAVEEQAAAPDRANWGNRLAILLGDMLLAKALELGGVVGAGVARCVVTTLEAASLGRLAQLGRAHRLDVSPRAVIVELDRTFGRLFELPCRLGALMGQTPHLSRALARYGRCFGVAYALAEEATAIENVAWSSALTADFESGIYGLPVLLALRTGGEPAVRLRRLLLAPQPDRAEVYGLVTATGVLTEVRRLALRHAALAQASLSSLDSGSTRASLDRLATFAATREVASEPDLVAAMDELRI